MKIPSLSIKTKVWLYPDNGGWHFVTIEKKDADYIKKEYIWPRKRFGSIPVNVSIGKTIWKTSIFPGKKSVG